MTLSAIGQITMGHAPGDLIADLHALAMAGVTG
jgi:hypothetical protein